MATIIQLRRDTAANWTAVNPVLQQGEPGVELDTNRVKYGNGTSTWNMLVYATIDTTSIVANAAVQSGQIDTLTANAAVQSGLLVGLEANAAVQSGLLVGLEANAAVQSGQIDTLTANAAVQSGQIDTLTANAAVQSGLLVGLEANAAVQSGLLVGLEANAAVQSGQIITANVNMKGYVDNQVSTLTSNAAVQSGLLVGLEANAAVQSGLITTLTANAAVQSGLLVGLEANAAVQSGLITTLTANAAVQSGQLSTLTANAAKLIYRRMPTAEDNSNKGYTVNSVWQYNGNMYKPTAAPDTTSALWSRLPARGGLPADILGANCKLAGGLGVYKAGFTGPCVQLTATVSSSPVTTDINILAGGILDEDAIIKVMATADVGTFVYVTTLYDQSGTGNHMVFAASAGKIARSLYIIWDAYFDAFVMAADNGGDSNGQGLNFPATLSVREDQIGAFFFGRATVAHHNSNSVIVASFGTSTTGLSMHVGEGTAGVTFAGWRGSSRRPSSANCAPIPSTAACAYYIGATGSVTVGCNELSYNFASAGDTTPYTGGFLGNWDLAVSKFSAMRFLGLAISTTTPPTVAQQTAIRHWFYTKYDVVPQARDRVVYVSDSRGWVTYSPDNASIINIGQAGENISLMLADALKSEVEVINASVSGFPNTQHASFTIPWMTATARTGVKNVAIVLMGVNDFLVNNLSAAQSITALNVNIDALKAAGWYVVVVAELATNNVTNNSNTRTAELSALILAGGTTADRIVNVLDMTALSVTTNYPDGLHPTSAQANLISARLAPIIDSILIS